MEGRRERLVASAVVLVAAVSLSVNTLQGEFVFDDHPAIQTNADVRSNTPLSVVFANDFWGISLSDSESHKSYRPLTILSFRLNHWLHGLWAPGFHACNVAAHAIVCILYLWTCLGLGVSLAPSLGAALLFAAHPIHTEAVANVVGRSEMLAAIFFLLALLSHQKSATKRSLFSLSWVVVTLALSVISLLCKEQGITAVGLCLVKEVLELIGNARKHPHTNGRIKHKQDRTRSSRHLPPLLPPLLPLVRVSLLSVSLLPILFVRIYLVGGGTPTFVDSDNPASFSPRHLTRALTYSHLWAVNFGLLLCPSRLCHDWSMGSIPLVESINDPRNLATLLFFIFSLAFVCGAVRNLIKTRPTTGGNYFERHVGSHFISNGNDIHSNGCARKATPTYLRPRVGIQTSPSSFSSSFESLSLLALSWTAIPFLPASNLFFSVGFVVAERVLYLPSMGACLLVSLGATALWRRTKRVTSLLLLSLFLSLLSLHSLKTLTRNAEWQTPWSIAQSAVKVNPGNAKVQMTVANELAQQGDRRCELFYREALHLRPQYSSAWANLGLVLINTDRPKEAEEAYSNALAHKPDHVNANTNMGHLCRLQKRWQEAKRYFSAALKRRPRNPNLHYYLALVSEEIGTTEDLKIAEKGYRETVQLSHTHWEAHYRLAQLLEATPPSQDHAHFSQDRLQEATFHYQKALQLNPDDVILHHQMGRHLMSMGQMREAEFHLRRTLSLSPGHEAALQDLATVRSKLERPYSNHSQTGGEPNHRS